MSAAQGLVVGVDVGGTFTDIFVCWTKRRAPPAW